MDFTYEDVNPTLIANTTMQKRLRDGVDYSYRITANDGYVLHDKALDTEEFDYEMMIPTGNIIRGYTEGTCTCAASYDFIANEREFYAVLRSEVPENQIFGGGNNNEHEVM